MAGVAKELVSNCLWFLCMLEVQTVKVFHTLSNTYIYLEYYNSSSRLDIANILQWNEFKMLISV